MTSSPSEPKTAAACGSNAGDTGITAPGFGQAIERGEDAARRVLDEFVAQGWATAEGMRPKLYRVTEAGRRAAEGAAAGGLEF